MMVYTCCTRFVGCNIHIYIYISQSFKECNITSRCNSSRSQGPMPDTSWPTCSMLDAAEVAACLSPTIACCRWVVPFGWVIVSLFLSFLYLPATTYSGHQEHHRSSKGFLVALLTVHLHYLTSLGQHPNGMDTIYLNRWEGAANWSL